MFLFDGNKFGHWFIKDLTTQTTWKHGIDWWHWNHDWNIHWTFWSGLFGNTWLSISFKVRSMIRGFIGALKLGFSSIDLKGMTSVFLPLERSEPTT